MLVVLSMHRSGSSLLTGLLQQNGFYCGDEEDLIAPARDNPRGFWELDFVNKANEALLAEDGYGHLIPNTDAVTKSTEVIEEQLGAAAKKLQDKKVTLLKDPRMCLTLDKWQAHMNIDKAIILVRNPIQVACSMKKRHKMPLSCGLALWDFYTRRAFANSENLDTKIVIFDDLVDDSERELKSILDWSIAKPNLPKPDLSFFDHKLIHNSSTVPNDSLMSESQRVLWESAVNKKWHSDISKDSQEAVAILVAMKSFSDMGYDPVHGRMLDSIADVELKRRADVIDKLVYTKQQFEDGLTKCRLAHQALKNDVKMLFESRSQRAYFTLLRLYLAIRGDEFSIVDRIERRIQQAHSEER